MNTIATSHPLPSSITQKERARRKASIENARGSVRFEGFVLSEEIEQINRRFIDGELSRQEHIEAVKAAVSYD